MLGWMMNLSMASNPSWKPCCCDGGPDPGTSVCTPTIKRNFQDDFSGTLSSEWTVASGSFSNISGKLVGDGNISTACGPFTNDFTRYNEIVVVDELDIVNFQNPAIRIFCSGVAALDFVYRYNSGFSRYELFNGSTVQILTGTLGANVTMRVEGLANADFSSWSARYFINGVQQTALDKTVSSGGPQARSIWCNTTYGIETTHTEFPPSANTFRFDDFDGGLTF